MVMNAFESIDETSEIGITTGEAHDDGTTTVAGT
jgi:hypothetical protein